MLGILASLMMDGPIVAPAGITAPAWVHKPSGEDIARVYPPKAMRESLGGRAAMHCKVDADGSLSGCEVTSEEPAGEGFGDATLKLAPKFRLQPTTHDGRPVGGGAIMIPIRFSTPIGARVNDIFVTDPGALEGAALVNCRVHGPVVDNCLLMSEEPRDKGLGEAAMQRAAKLQLKAAVSARFEVKFVFRKGPLANGPTLP